MSDAVIKVENLSKKYVIAHQTNGSGGRGTLRDAITDGFKSVSKRFTKKSDIDPGHEDFWALNDISFEIKQGDRVGIIGRNGAGKSTLLKILSRITEPTHGRITIEGRVASLLEVGTGFHAELTGRENIFLNGAILGMSRQEIKRKFDEIVDFSEVEKFLDTPVKRYSSGMYVRLAFAVAAHLEPEILIVDEVLAVGDIEFQDKCLGKMQEISQKHQRTVIFVSHNMAAINALCSRSILLRNGQLVADGKTGEIIPLYAQPIGKNNSDLMQRADRKGNKMVIATNVSFCNASNLAINNIHCGDDITIRIDYKNNTGDYISNIHIGIGFYDLYGRLMTMLQTEPLNSSLNAEKNGGAFLCHIPKFRLVPGKYWLNYDIYHYRYEDMCDSLQQALEFEVYEGDFFGTGKLTWYGMGGVLFEHGWKSEN
ncbi:ABC transporter ATP-binding protein [Methylobacter sp. BBA5.1]|uniref:ABC transporter ATP-binding protein n=1 Tax=Methylobacter sp. BBA5.1 TaxID=1495064 RepID=UPI0005668084|nr:ABC transporter ATP-binding protein [Methylobacter sp. BBA5.1]